MSLQPRIQAEAEANSSNLLLAVGDFVAGRYANLTRVSDEEAAKAKLTLNHLFCLAVVFLHPSIDLAARYLKGKQSTYSAESCTVLAGLPDQAYNAHVWSQILVRCTENRCFLFRLITIVGLCSTSLAGFNKAVPTRSETTKDGRARRKRRGRCRLVGSSNTTSPHWRLHSFMSLRFSGWILATHTERRTTTSRYAFLHRRELTEQ